MMRLADLHLHLPMHLPVAPERTRRNRMDRRRAWTLARLGRDINHDTALGEPRVTTASLAESSVERVEAAVAVEPRLGMARGAADIDPLVAAGRTAVLHCVEGAFHLGRTPPAVRAAVRELADRGVAYLTVAHLFPRGVATVAPTLPRLSDRAYGALFRQPRAGLSELGRAAVEAAVEHQVVVDVSHMSNQSLDETFALLDALDPARTAPVMASHVGHRFGEEAYTVTPETTTRIAERDGVVGIIASEPHLRHGLADRKADGFAEGAELFLRHVDAIAAVTGSHRHLAIGSDLGGFIDPLPGVDNVRELPRLLGAVERRLGPRAAEAIGAGNVERVLRRPR